MKQNPLLFDAVRLGKLAVVKRLLKRGGDPDACDEEGWRPLHWASQEGFTDVVKLLIKHGAVVDPREEIGFTPLAIAAGAGHISVVRELLKAGASPNTRIKSCDDGTPLHIACSWNREEVIGALLETEGVELNARDGNGKTPLAYMIEVGNKRMVDALIRHGAAI